MAELIRYVSIKSVIDDLYGNTGIQESLSYSDLISWVFDAMELIGAKLTYIPKVLGWKEDDSLNFTDYVFPAPCDLHDIEVVMINGIQAMPSTSSIQYLKGGKCCTNISDIPESASIQFQDNFENQFSNILGNENIFNNTLGGITYDISDGIFTTNIKSGRVCLFYNAFPVDETGIPKIPDKIKYRLAVKHYLRMILDYRNWRNDPESSGKHELYTDSSREWNWYVGAAKTESVLQTVSEMENMKRQMLHLKPNINKFENFFSTLSANTGIRR